MCYDSDLFGDVIVTLNDINLWLDAIPDMQGASQTRRNYYALNNDVANKIKLSKINGTFENIIYVAENAAEYSKLTVDIYKTIYKTNVIELQSIKCPDYFHTCNNPKCEVYIKRIKHEKYAADYAKRKKYKRAA